MSHTRMLSQRLAVSSFALLLAGLAGCSAPTDDGSVSHDDDLHVKPNGSDLPGNLLLELPANAANVDPTTITYKDQPITIGTVFKGLPAGDADIRTLTTGSVFLDVMGGFKAKIVSNQTTTITLALLGVDAVSGPATLGLNVPDHSYETGTGLYLDGSSGGKIAPTSDGARRLPIAAGEHEVNFGLDQIDGVPVTLAEGDNKRINLTDPAGRRVARLEAPTRDLPEAVCGGFWEISTPRAFGVANKIVTVKGGETLDLGVSPRHEGKGYQLRASSWSRAIQVPLGDRGAAPKVLALGRIDVDDVSLNGGPSTVKGTYDVFPADASGKASGGSILICHPATNTGVDVLPGHYRVEVTYRTVEAGTKTDVHIIDVP